MLLPGDRYRPPGILFDGTSDDAVRSSALVGAAASKEVLYFQWLRKDGGDGAARVLMAVNDATSDSGVEWRVGLTASNTLNISALNSGKSTILNATSAETITADGIWKPLAITADLSSASKRHVRLAGVALNMTWTTYSNAAIDIAMANVRLMANAAGGARWNGGAAQILFHCGAGAYLDLSIPAVERRLMRNAKCPTDFGPIGARPLGFQPLVYLNDKAPTFGRNRGTGGDFTITGAVDPTGGP